MMIGVYIITAIALAVILITVRNLIGEKEKLEMNKYRKFYIFSALMPVYNLVVFLYLAFGIVSAMLKERSKYNEDC